MSAALYRSVAANLDRIAEDISSCDSMVVERCRARLPEVLQGAATAFLVGQMDECSSDLNGARAILTRSAAVARQQAAAIEAAAAGVVAETIAAATLDAADEDTAEPSASSIPLF